ncbi:hypothetical protein [Psychromonas sp. Urea-02u-13]|uniref:hypothetical protein n=1 Tax=Psychromonas sp. Urea-02u-13 TaxID=2058326 RepID=UPI000C3372CF|nr:hypothetical protein [Psychromonas sp. Urea-02u-13]PKG40830.1 hypothetical protein CXF74_01440 [Psychromonas sp. Urea-02u-13]
MANYQFFKHQENKSLVHLDVDSDSFYNEKQQLLTQGFHTHGDTIQAATTEEAYSRARNIMMESVEQYGMAHTGGGLFYFLQGIYELITGKKKKS